MKLISLKRKSSDKASAPQRQLNAEELEARVLYSAAPVAFVDAPQEATELVSDTFAGHGFEALDAFYDQSQKPAHKEVTTNPTPVTLTSFNHLSNQEIASLQALPVGVDTFQVDLAVEAGALSSGYQITPDLDSGAAYITGLMLQPQSFATHISAGNFATTIDSFSEIAPATELDSGSLARNQLVDDAGEVDSGTPHFELSLNGEGRENLKISCNITGDEAAMLQYRIGNFGAFNNIPSDLISGAANGATTDLVATLPFAANGQPEIQIRFLTVGTGSGFAIGDLQISSDSE